MAFFYDIAKLTSKPGAFQYQRRLATEPETQAARAIPIPKDKLDLNVEAEAALAKAGSPLQYYQLIDTQWPTDPAAPPTPWTAGLPGAINNKPGGNPTPVYLTNMTMETYFQKGVQPACQLEELPNNVKCPPVWNPPPAPPLADGTLVFGTESCMGCHSSAGEACRRPMRVTSRW